MSTKLVRAAVCVALTAIVPVASALSTREAAAAKPGKVIDVSSMKVLFKKQNRIAIAGYQVAFVTRNKATAKAAGMLSSGSGAKASLQTFLGNVDHDLMQSIVDEAHAKFVAKMQEAGLEIVPMETVKAAAAFQQLETVPASAAQAYNVEFQGAHYVILPVTGLPLWFNQYDGLAGGKGSKKNMKLMAQLSKELDAAILQPSIAVDFAYLEKSGGMLANRASVEAQSGMMVVPAASVFWGSVETLTYTKFVDGFWAEGGTGKWVSADEANNRALVKGLAGLGIDIGPVSSKKAIVLEADRDAYREKTLELLEGTSEAYRKGVLEIRK